MYISEHNIYHCFIATQAMIARDLIIAQLDLRFSVSAHYSKQTHHVDNALVKSRFIHTIPSERISLVYKVHVNQSFEGFSVNDII